MIREKISDFLSHLALPEKKYSGDQIFHLGKSFEQDDLLKQIKIIVADKFSKKQDTKLDKEGVKKILIKGKLLSLSLNQSEKFNLFVLLFNNYFNAHSNAFFSNSNIAIKLIAKALDIDKKDYDYVLDFYNNALYFDKNDAVFISFEGDNKLIKSKGINIHFLSNNSNEIIYLKYFKRFDVFLSKTFIKHWSKLSIEELITTKEINLVNSKNFSKSEYYFNSFDDLKLAVFDFDPFQYIEVEHTEYTPKIILDPELSFIRLSGNSRPISTTAYFEPIFEWIDNYGKHGKSYLNIHFQFQHINTYTMRFLLRLIRILNHYTLDKKKINIVWIYDAEDEDAKEFGEQLRHLYLQKEKFLLKTEFEKAKI